MVGVSCQNVLVFAKSAKCPVFCRRLPVHFKEMKAEDPKFSVKTISIAMFYFIHRFRSI